MLTHWLAAITLVPSIFAIVRPKFVARGVEQTTAEPMRSRPEALFTRAN
jgi:hypothetical protein